MSEARPYASLSSGLLARKGGAKPAMRPAAFGQVAPSLEDLGWNDMGHAPEPVHEHIPNPVTGLTPAPGGRTRPHVVDLGDAHDEPPVVEQQRVLEAHFAPEQVQQDEPEAVEAAEAEAEAAQPAAVVALPRRRNRDRSRAAKAKVPARAKSAFTLRLDSERHLKLRLACAVTGRSAQLLVTEAVDALLEQLPEIDALARRVNHDHSKRTG